MGGWRRGLVLLLALAACEHTAPFEFEPELPLGPFDEGLLRQLTFNPLEDRDPSGRGDIVVFSREEPSAVVTEDEPTDSDRCLAFLPADGGTLLGTVCPAINDTDEAWIQPVLSPDGSQLAYVREAALPGRTPFSRELVVAPFEAPERADVILRASYGLPDGRRANAFGQITWRDGETLRFLASDATFNGGTLEPVLTPVALVDADVTAGELTIVPGVATPQVYAPAPDGGVWFVRQDERSPAASTVRHLPLDGGTATVVGDFPGEIHHLTQVDGTPIGIFFIPTLEPLFGSKDRAGAMDPSSGSVSFVQVPFAPIHVAGIPNTTRLLLEGRTGTSTPSDLWLVDRQ